MSLIVAFALVVAGSVPNADDAYSVYQACVKKQVSQLIGAGESATVTADAAISACDARHVEAQLQLHRAAKYPGTAETVLAEFDKQTRDDAILQVMRARSKKNARR